MMRIIAIALLVGIAGPANATMGSWVNDSGGSIDIQFLGGGRATAASWDPSKTQHRDLEGTWSLIAGGRKVTWSSLGVTKCYIKGHLSGESC
jgi:hypothetical protein